MPTNTRLHELSEVVSQTATTNGFSTITWDTVPAHLMFVVTEVDEATQASSFEELSEELADIAIRLLVHLYAFWGRDWSLRRPRVSRGERFGQDISKQLGYVTHAVSQAAQCWRCGQTQRTKDDLRTLLELALAEVVETAVSFGVDLEAAISEKNEWNTRRPYLHGRAEAIG